jgi:hypothetical protein
VNTTPLSFVAVAVGYEDMTPWNMAEFVSLALHTQCLSFMSFQLRFIGIFWRGGVGCFVKCVSRASLFRLTDELRLG